MAFQPRYRLIPKILRQIKAIERTARWGTGWQAGIDTPDQIAPVIRAIKNRFGASSEKNPDQGDIFNEAELAACDVDEEPAADIDDSPEPVKATGKPGRKPL